MNPRVPLYQRLPEIYRIRDAEQLPPDQLRAYLAAFEQVFSAIHENIEALYHDLFIETCDDWVIPYLADLVGTSHLKGDPRTLRADVADTIALRRRKGTLGAIERLAANLTGWAARAVELRESLGWTQHLNHQRADAGGRPPLADPALTRFHVPRGGTVPVRDPAMLSLLATPFDPFAYTIDTKPAVDDRLHFNLPNLAIFLWRLAAYRVRVTRPVFANPLPLSPIAGATGAAAQFGARFEFHPLGRPVRLFNTFRAEPPRLTQLDEVPGPIPDARLTTGSEAGNPTAYVDVDVYTPAAPPIGLDVGESGIQLFFPQADFAGETWTFRGDNLCAWENGLRRPLLNREIVIDPDIGRLLIGLALQTEVETVRETLLAGYTYGAVGEIGAQPIDHGERPQTLGGAPPTVRVINGFVNPDALRDALADIHNVTAPVLIEIADSLVHELDLNAIELASATAIEGGFRTLRLGRSLGIRAADGHRPIIRLAQPLRFRPATVVAANPADQAAADAVVRNLTVRFQGVYLVAGEGGGFAADDALIMRAALARLEILDCTLDPGGYRERREELRTPLRAGLSLTNGYGFADPIEEDVFQPTPDILIQRSITGTLRLDDGYALVIEDSIVDGGAGPDLEPAGGIFALTGATDPDGGWSAPLTLHNVTFFGRVRATTARGHGGIFARRLEVLQHQTGCIKYSWFRGVGDRLPQNHACLAAADAPLIFTSTWFADPGHGQISRASDRRILTRGLGDDAMGATNFLLEAHRWTNFNIRLREFMPVGVRPLVIPVT
jgi:hypothetical protein